MSEMNPPIKNHDSVIGQNSANSAELAEVTTSDNPANAKESTDAPKSQSTGSEKDTAASAVFFTKQATVYKSDGESLKSVGKYGIYLTSTASNPRNIEIYKYDKIVLDAVKLRDDIKIHVENEYIKIRGKNNEQWYLQFDEPKSSVEFLNKLKEANVTIVNDDVNDNNIKVNGNEPVQVTISARGSNMRSRIRANNMKSKSSTIDDINSPATGTNFNENLDPVDDTNVNQLNLPINSSQSSPNITITTETPFHEIKSIVSKNHDNEMKLNLMLSKLDNVLSELPKIAEQNLLKLENELLKSRISDLETNINEPVKLEEPNNSNRKCSELEKLLMNKVIDLENSLSTLGESEENRLNEKIRTLECQLKNAENKMEEYKSKGEFLQGTNEGLLKINEELNREINLLKRGKLEETIKGFTDIINDSMDMMYRNINEQLDESIEEQTEIKTILSKQMMQTTLGVIKRFDSNISPKKRKLQ